MNPRHAPDTVSRVAITNRHLGVRDSEGAEALLVQTLVGRPDSLLDEIGDVPLELQSKLPIVSLHEVRCPRMTDEAPHFEERESSS